VQRDEGGQPLVRNRRYLKPVEPSSYARRTAPPAPTPARDSQSPQVTEPRRSKTPRWAVKESKPTTVEAVEQENSSGFHFVEIHMPTAGVSVIVIIIIFVIFLGCRRLMCFGRRP
jgi:hypothetical protein